jgi:hypothetical protein
MEAQEHLTLLLELLVRAVAADPLQALLPRHRVLAVLAVAVMLILMAQQTMAVVEARQTQIWVLAVLVL